MSFPEDLLLTTEDISDQLAEDFVTEAPSETEPPISDDPEVQSFIATLDIPEDSNDDETEQLESELITLDEMIVMPAEEEEIEPDIRRKRFFPVFFRMSLAAAVLIVPFFALRETQIARKIAGTVTEKFSSAISLLGTGAQAAAASDAGGARSAFENAQLQLSDAQKSLDELGGLTKGILSALPNARAGAAMLSVGEEVSSAGALLSEGISQAQSRSHDPLTDRLALLSVYIDQALPHLTNAKGTVETIEVSSIPADHQVAFIELSRDLAVSTSTLESFKQINDLLIHVMGGEGTKRYLVLFQNNTELRATGGFIGSFAEIAVRDGEITDIRIPKGGSYDVRGSLQEFIAAPVPLQLLSARFEFQDGNWFPDFPTSSRQLLDFYAAAGGPSLDGVIAVNATTMVDWLKLLGPIDMPTYGTTLTAENFLATTQDLVENKYDKEANTPKAFIGDLAPVLMEKAIAKAGEDILPLLDLIQTHLSGRDIQLYFTENSLEKEARDLGFGGELLWTDRDYLALINSNLGGGKTDQVMGEDAVIDVDVDADGNIINTLTVTRKHYGIAGEAFSGFNNVTYVRAYVPKGSKLISASGFTIPDASLFEVPDQSWPMDDDIEYGEGQATADETSKTNIWEEQGKTVFGNWVQTMPGTSTSYTFRYKLPFRLQTELPTDTLSQKITSYWKEASDTYSILLQKQAGTSDRRVKVRLHLPPTLEVGWASKDLTEASLSWKNDGFLSALIRPTQH